MFSYTMYCQVVLVTLFSRYFALISMNIVKEKKITQWHLLQMVRKTLFKGNCLDSIGTTVMGSCNGGERLGSTLNTTKKSGNF